MEKALKRYRQHASLPTLPDVAIGVKFRLIFNATNGLLNAHGLEVFFGPLGLFCLAVITISLLQKRGEIDDLLLPGGWQTTDHAD